MATSRRFQAEMETTDVRQFGDEAVVPDCYTLLRVIRFGFPADLSSFCQIFKVAHYQNLIMRMSVRRFWLILKSASSKSRCGFVPWFSVLALCLDIGRKNGGAVFGFMNTASNTA